MATLYLRNVPDDVSDRLATLATREGMSVSAFAVRELASASKRADNEALLSELPDLSVSAKAVVADLEAGRASR
jgi:plasmid stability protein